MEASGQLLRHSQNCLPASHSHSHVSIDTEVGKERRLLTLPGGYDASKEGRRHCELGREACWCIASLQNGTETIVWCLTVLRLVPRKAQV